MWYLQDEGYVFVFLPWTGVLCCDEQEQGLFVYWVFEFGSVGTGLQDVVRMIVQYLQDEGYVASIMTIQDEANVRFTEHLKNRSHFKGIKTAILGKSILFSPLLFVSYLP